jgi:hypothetical protein
LKDPENRKFSEEIKRALQGAERVQRLRSTQVEVAICRLTLCVFSLEFIVAPGLREYFLNLERAHIDA